MYLFQQFYFISLNMNLSMNLEVVTAHLSFSLIPLLFYSIIIFFLYFSILSTLPLFLNPEYTITHPLIRITNTHLQLHSQKTYTSAHIHTWWHLLKCTRTHSLPYSNMRSHPLHISVSITHTLSLSRTHPHAFLSLGLFSRLSLLERHCDCLHHVCMSERPHRCCCRCRWYDD